MRLFFLDLARYASLIFVIALIGGIALVNLYGCATSPSGKAAIVVLLPSRSLSQVDIQGHQRGTPDDYCPLQYIEYVPETGFFLLCWGDSR